MESIQFKIYQISMASQVEAIFFESSTKKVFSNDEERKSFSWKYFDYYLTNYPQFAFVAEQGSKILGYVIGSPSSTDPELFKIQPHLQSFEKYFSLYPAHLHINCHHEARGLGIGSKLVQTFDNSLQVTNTSGLHIMTGPDSRNRSFYQNLGFNFEVTEFYQGHPILMMGKTLTGLVSHI